MRSMPEDWTRQDKERDNEKQKARPLAQGRGTRDRERTRLRRKNFDNQTSKDQRVRFSHTSQHVPRKQQTAQQRQTADRKQQTAQQRQTADRKQQTAGSPVEKHPLDRTQSNAIYTDTGESAMEEENNHGSGATAKEQADTFEEWNDELKRQLDNATEAAQQPDEATIPNPGAQHHDAYAHSQARSPQQHRETTSDHVQSAVTQAEQARPEQSGHSHEQPVQKNYGEQLQPTGVEEFALSPQAATLVSAVGAGTLASALVSGLAPFGIAMVVWGAVSLYYEQNS